MPKEAKKAAYREPTPVTKDPEKESKASFPVTEAVAEKPAEPVPAETPETPDSAPAEPEEVLEKPKRARLNPKLPVLPGGLTSALRKPIGGLSRPRAQQPLDTSPPPSRPVLVEFRDVSKHYDTHLALDHISLKLYKGEFLSLVGPSGAGKSTLIKCVTLQEWPDAGRIIVAGRDITLLKSRELPYYRRKVGIVFQDFKLLPLKTVYENVAFALEVSGMANKEIRRRVELMLDTVSMGHKRNNFPHELSGGEQQRVAIARALVHDPKILIADEPTGNLDPVNTWEIIELLYKINKSGTMVILATHDREIVDALKKRVITMRAGQVVSDQEKGTYLV